MLWETFCLIMLFVKKNAAVLCYNCSATQRDWIQCGGDFIPWTQPYNTTRKNLINCTGDNPMCFVRSWSARTRHAWIVQRGCYQATVDDGLPRLMNTPTRAMSCRVERFPEAEYRVCLCQANWCNSASTIVPNVMQYITRLSRYLIEKTISYTGILTILGMLL